MIFEQVQLNNQCYLKIFKLNYKEFKKKIEKNLIKEKYQ